MVAFTVFSPGGSCEFSLITVHGNYFNLSTMQKQIKLPAAGLSFFGLNDNPCLQRIEGTYQFAGFIGNCSEKDIASGSPNSIAIKAEVWITIILELLSGRSLIFGYF